MKPKTFLTAALVAVGAIALPQAGSAMPAAPLAVDAPQPLVTPVHDGIYWRHKRPYWRGYPGFYQRRPGYRFYGGYWFPHAAFGVIITPAPRYRAYPRYRYYDSGPGGLPTYQLTPAHYRWCESRYRSYRRHDNSFQPYHGPRKQCTSPYLRRIR